MTDSTEAKKEVKADAAKSASYTMTTLQFALKQFSQAFGSVPTIYKAVYPVLSARELAKVKQAVKELETEATEARTAANLKLEALKAAEKALEAVDEKADKTLATTAVEAAKKEFTEADKAAKEAEAELSSSFMKAIKTGLNYAGRFVVGTVSTPFWIVAQALNFALRMVVAAVSLVAAAPVGVVEGIAYAVNAVINGVSSVATSLFGKKDANDKNLDEEHAGKGADKKDSKTDKKEEQPKPEYTLAMFVESAIAAQDSAARKVAEALKANPDAVISEDDKRGLEAEYTNELTAIADANHSTPANDFQNLTVENLIDAIKGVVTVENYELPKAVPRNKV